MKLTPKRRATIYHKAAEYFSTADWIYYGQTRGFCQYLEKYYPKLNIADFPEILHFIHNCDYLGYWLDAEYISQISPICNHNQRIMCLLLAEQMALNPIFKL